MLDDSQWMRLLEGLTQHTGNDKIKWNRKESSTGGTSISGFVARGLSNAMNKPKIFGATAGTGSYEITSSDDYGLAPYELRVWEVKGTKIFPVGILKSSSNVDDDVRFRLNKALEQLFKTVDTSTESSEEIVDRLLEGF